MVGKLSTYYMLIWVFIVFFVVPPRQSKLHQFPLEAQVNCEVGSRSESTQFAELFYFGRGRAYAIDANPDGTLLAVTGEDGLWLYDVETLTPVQQLQVHPYYSPALTWSPDGSKIAVYLGPQTGIAVYDIRQQEVSTVLLSTNDHYTTNVYTLSWSPDGRKLAAIGTTPWRVWDIMSAQVLVEFSNVTIPESVLVFYDGLSHLLAWSPDGNQIALPDGESISIFDADTWEREEILDSALDRITSLDWSSGNELAVIAQGEPIQIWDMQSSQLLSEFPLEGDHLVGQWSGDGNTLAVSGSSLIYLLNTEQQIIVATMQGHLSTVIDFVWATGDQYLISRGREGSIYTWDIETAQPLATLISYGEVGNPTWSPDGTKLAVGLREGNNTDFEAVMSRVRVWDTTSWELVTDLSIESPTPELDSLTWSPNGNWLAMSVRNSIHVWNASQNWTASAIDLGRSTSIAVRNLTWSLDGTQLAIVTSEGSQTVQSSEYPLGDVVRILSVDTQVVDLALDDDNVLQALPLSTPNGWIIIKSTNDGIYVQAIDDAESDLVAPEGYIIDAVNTPTGILLASIVDTVDQQNRLVRIYNVSAQEQVLSIAGDYAVSGYPVIGLSSNGRLLKLRRNSGEYILLNVNARREIAAPSFVQTSMSDMLWSPDETCIASPLLSDNQIVIWGVNTGQPVATITTFGSSVRHITWSPGGEMLATTGNSAITIWGYREA